MRTSILRPGFLVNVKSKVETGVRYQRREISQDQASASDSVVTKYEVTKIEPDPAETKRAQQARGKACSEILKVCVQSRYVDICPTERKAELDAAEARALQIVAAHNASAVTTRIFFYPSAWLMADPSEATIRKISQEMVDLLNDMATGIDRADPVLIGEAATRASEMVGMLAEEQVKTVVDAVEQARKAKRDITRRVGKKGEEIAAVLRDVQRGAIEKARFAFMDVDDVPNAPASEPPPVDVARFADLECEAPAVESTETSATETTGEAPSGEEVAASA